MPTITINLNEIRSEITKSLKAYQTLSTETDEKWLTQYLIQELQYSSTQAQNESKKIISVQQSYTKKRESLKAHTSAQKPKESWLTRELLQSQHGLSQQHFNSYLSRIDKTIHETNSNLAETITRNDGKINQSPQLDGFIAEAEHAGSFNMDAAIKDKTNLKAEVLEPAPGQTYGKNSVDIVIKDEGKIVGRYQSKYGKNSEATEKLFEHGDYRGQQKLIPQGQQIDKKSTTQIEADGVQSSPLSKERAKEIQEKIQKTGEVPQKSWNDFEQKTILAEFSKQTLYSGLLGAGIGAGATLFTQIKNDEIDEDKIAKEALKSGLKSGAQTAVSGALKVYAEKTLPTTILRSTLPFRNIAIATTACASIEMGHSLYLLGKGEIDPEEAYNQIEETACVTSSSLTGGAFGAKGGASAGTFIGSIIPGAGTAICAAAGAFIGGTLGSIAGSKAGEAVASGCRKVRSTAKKIGNAICSGTKKVISTVCSAASSAFDSICSLFS